MLFLNRGVEPAESKRETDAVRAKVTKSNTSDVNASNNVAMRYHDSLEVR